MNRIEFRVISEETRRKMSIAHSGRKHTEETKKKLSIMKIGKPFPHEGRPRSEETRRKLSILHAGKRLSEEHKAKIKIALSKRDYKVSDELKQRLSDMKKGNKSNLWKGGLTNKNKLVRVSSEYKTWRGKIFERDDWTCQNCGIKGGNLHPHHIKPFSQYLNLRFEINNGITLCHDCHKNTESYGRNNYEQDRI